MGTDRFKNIKPAKSKLRLENFGQHCPKCEYEGLDIQFKPHFYGADKMKDAKLQEYLKTTCLMCSYQWNMKTADAKDRAHKKAPKRPGRQGPWCK